MKKLLKTTLIISALTALTAVNAFAASSTETVTALESGHKIQMNGDVCLAEVYNIAGSNYMKLRDIACMLDGSDAQFEIEYDHAEGAINLAEGRGYTEVGGEMTGTARTQQAVQSTDTVLKDGEKISIKGYKIHGNNFYRLVDVLGYFDAEITYDNASKTVSIVTKDGLSFYERRILERVNEERGKVGLKALTYNEELADVADIKAADMRDSDYFDHISPVYGFPFDMMKSFNIKYTAAGENIAIGYKTPESVMEGWMNSQGHKENILRDKFEQIGIGFEIDDSGYTYWVQMFIK